MDISTANGPKPATPGATPANAGRVRGEPRPARTYRAARRNEWRAVRKAISGADRVLIPWVSDTIARGLVKIRHVHPRPHPLTFKERQAIKAAQRSAIAPVVASAIALLRAAWLEGRKRLALLRGKQ